MAAAALGEASADALNSIPRPTRQRIDAARNIRFAPAIGKFIQPPTGVTRARGAENKKSALSLQSFTGRVGVRAERARGQREVTGSERRGRPG